MVVENLFPFFFRQMFDMYHHLGFLYEWESGFLNVISCGSIDVVARGEQDPRAPPNCGMYVWEYPIPANGIRPVNLGCTEGIVHPKELFWLMWIRMSNKVVGAADLKGGATPLIQRTYS